MEEKNKIEGEGNNQGHEKRKGRNYGGKEVSEMREVGKE